MKKKAPKQMEVKPALALPEGLELVGLERSDGVLTVTVVSTQLSPCCPLCGVVASRIHSHYSRQVADLPCGGQPVRMRLQVRKFFCEEPTCARKIFVERLLPFVEPWARVTQRLFQVVQVIGVLADRKAETAAAWMAAHPEITLVSRDRGTDYASATTTGAPQAVQCADRFHILKNLGEALEGCLARHLAAQRKTQTQESQESYTPIEEMPRSARRSPKVERLQQAYRAERLARYEQVLALRNRGMSQAAIAERVGIGHSTVSNWLAAGTYPETTRGPYVSRIDPYLPYLFERWDSGCHNMVRLHQELTERGYKGPYASVRDHIIRRLPDGKKNGAKSCELTPAPLPSKQATFLFLRHPENLDEEEQEKVRQLRQISAEVDQAYDLVQQFAQMLRTLTGEDLDSWLAKALASQIPELRSFVQGIERDKAAVKAGLTLPTSNGIVEGKVHKLKLIKRMGYGRAGFPLLRQRVLHAL